MPYLTLGSPQSRSHALLAPGSRFIAVSNPTFESKAPLTMFARLHILAHTACRNSASSTGAKSQKAVYPLIPPKRVQIYTEDQILNVTVSSNSNLLYPHRKTKSGL